MSLKKFLTKHAGELSSVVSVIGTVIKLIPGNNADKRNINGALNDLQKAADSIAKSAKKMPALDIEIDKAMLTEVVKELLPEIIEQVAAKVFEAKVDDKK